MVETKRTLPPQLSVIIAAHDEEHALRACLDALLHQTVDRRVEVVVVANGCTDGTVKVARELLGRAPQGWHAVVTELPTPCKWEALNVGDEAASAGVRVYLDADVLLSETSLASIARCLDVSHPRICRPALLAAPSPSALVRSYVRVWERLPYVRNHLVGAGCYAVNAAGRRLWGRFPDLGGDDNYVLRHFRGEEVVVLDDALMLLSFPAICWEMIAVRSRWIRNTREVTIAFPTLLAEGSRRRVLDSAQWMVRTPSAWRWVPGFLLVWSTAWLWSWRTSAGEQWERASSAPVRQAARPLASP